MNDADVIRVLVWISSVAAAALVTCLVWYAQRVVNQLDRMESANTDESKRNSEEFHKMDIRVTRMEAWREGRDAREILRRAEDKV